MAPIVDRELQLVEGNALARGSGVIWLLCLVKHAGTHPAIQARLPQVQAVFTRMLADTNDVVQEAASKGLALVFEIGDASMKETLVNQLVSTLSSTDKGKKAYTQVSSDTALLPEGALGEAPGGGGLSTYQELCSMAADLGQPDLIYKFLDLAGHHALWNSRKGMAMGFGSIAARARSHLAPYLPSLIPKLYRYQYDPNPKVQEAMTNIWAALVPEGKKVVDTYLGAIMKELLSSMGSRVWRVREASCLALADLLPGRKVEQVAEYLPEMWNMTFRALDDIKESVRKAAGAGSKALTGLCARMCNPDQTSPTELKKAVAIVLPFLVNKGITNPAEDVRKTAIATLQKIMTSAGPALREHIGDIVPVLLENMTSLEPAAMNYIQLNADKYDMNEEALESARISAATSGPLAKAVEQCVKFVDTEQMAILAPKLIQLIRSGVGLPTRAGTARFITLVSNSAPDTLKPHAPKLLKALTSAIVTEKSPALRKVWAACAGQVSRVAKESTAEEMIAKIVQLYSDPGTVESRLVSAVALKELSKQAPDVVKRYLAQVIPVAFIGRRADEKDTREAMKEVWEEHSPGLSSGVRLYMTELVDVVISSLNNASWPIKRQGALALRDMAESASGSSLADYLPKLLPVLLEMLPGRLWDGKEDVLLALAAVAKAAPLPYYHPLPLPPPPPPAPSGTTEGTPPPPPISAQQIIKAALQECKRPKRDYRTKALECLSMLLGTFSSLDVFAEVSEVVLPLAGPPSEEKSDDTEENARLKAKADEVLREKALDCLGNAWPSTGAESTYQTHAVILLDVLVKGYIGAGPSVRAAALGASKRYFERMPVGMWTTEMLTRVLEPLAICASDGKNNQVRFAAMDVLEALIKRIRPQELLFDSIKNRVIQVVQEFCLDKETKVQLPALNLRASLLEGNPSSSSSSSSSKP
eukprot:CAMPEP_0184674414 /NCGR_PEP_ID=MMETSP0308-20130426/87221_1 /TAXON_ID=38269 /ORGANISM="Gloeochaete witrockiana, Strain SAG 46.84" /LENGTH=929 /DNA_ID=CAMNT_0027122009 /DNA_START=29 /DNA_END=2819 /DNA_ORIENTATION=-